MHFANGNLCPEIGLLFPAEFMCLVPRHYLICGRGAICC